MTSLTLYIPSVGDAQGHRRIVGWTANCANAKAESVLWHRTWVANGRLRNGDVADAMHQSRWLYHNKVKNLICSQEYELLNSMADSHLSDESRYFWREARRRKGKKDVSSVVNGVSTPQGIAEAFKDDISCLFNSMHGSHSGLDDLRHSLSSSCSDKQWVPFFATDVSVAIKQLLFDKMDADGCLCSSALCKGPVSLVTHLTAH